MPDTITPEVSAPQVKAVDVLAGGEAPSFKGKKTEFQIALEKAHERKKNAAEAQGKNPLDPKDILGKATEVPEYTSADLTETVTKLNAPNELKQTMEPLVQYIEAVKKTKREGMDITTALGTKAQSVQEAVGKILVERGSLGRKFEGLENAYHNSNDLYRYIEQNLARDPEFQSEMAKVLTEIYDKTKKLESIGQSEEKTNLTLQKEPLTRLQETFIEQVVSAFGDRLDTDQKDRVKKVIELGSEPSTIIEALKIELKIDTSLDTYKDLVNTYNQYDIEFNNFNAAESREKNNKPSNPKAMDAWQRRLESLENQRDAAMRAREQANRQEIAIKNAYMLTHPDIDTEEKFDSERHQHEQASNLLKENGPVQKLLETAVKNQTKITAIEAQIKQIESNPENAEAAKKKLELIRELEGAVDAAMSKFLQKRFDVAAADADILLEAARKRAEKEGETWRAVSTGKIQKEFEGIRKYDAKQRKYVINKDGVAKHIRNITELSADGSDGTREVFAQTTGFEMDPEKLKNKIASEIINGATYDALPADKKLDADTLIQQRITDFESLYAEHGDAFKKTLFESYTASKGFLDRFSWGTLGLTEDEMKILNSQFGDVMDNALEKSSLYKSMKEKGLVPGTKLKVMLAILAILGITAATVGIAPAAVAVGTAAKELGTTAWS